MSEAMRATSSLSVYALRADWNAWTWRQWRMRKTVKGRGISSKGEGIFQNQMFLFIENKEFRLQRGGIPLFSSSLIRHCTQSINHYVVSIAATTLLYRCSVVLLWFHITHSPTHSLTHLLSHSLTHSLTMWFQSLRWLCFTVEALYCCDFI